MATDISKDERWCSTCHGNGSFTAPYDGNCPEPHGKERLRSLQGERPTGDYKQAEATASKDSRSESPAPILPSSKTVIKHERRVVGHASGWKEQMDSCVCGNPWPCAKTLAQRIAEQTVRNVCELPDYTSPDDQLDLVMCTVQQLEACVLQAFENIEECSANETSEERVKIWCATCGEFGAHAPGCRRGVDDQEIAEGLGIARNSGRLPEEPKAHQHQWVPASTQGQETCVSCHEYRPAVKASEQPRTPVYPDDWKKPNKVGCKNFQLRGGEYCGNCGFHASEHDNI